MSYSICFVQNRRRLAALESSELGGQLIHHVYMVPTSTLPWNVLRLAMVHRASGQVVVKEGQEFRCKFVNSAQIDWQPHAQNSPFANLGP